MTKQNLDESFIIVAVIQVSFPGLLSSVSHSRALELCVSFPGLLSSVSHSQGS